MLLRTRGLETLYFVIPLAQRGTTARGMYCMSTKYKQVPVPHDKPLLSALSPNKGPLIPIHPSTPSTPFTPSTPSSSFLFEMSHISLLTRSLNEDDTAK